MTREPTAPPLPVRSSSWAEAAAVADALSDVPPAPAAPPTPLRRPAAAPPARDPELEPQVAEADATALPTSFVREQKPRPKKGFRGFLYRASGGAWNLGPSAHEREEDELARRISRQLQGSFNTAVLSLKGGIGKTSTTVGVGLTLGRVPCGDPPCAIDANPDSGDLVERAPGRGNLPEGHAPDRLRTCSRHRLGKLTHRPSPLHAPRRPAAPHRRGAGP